MKKLAIVLSALMLTFSSAAHAGPRGSAANAGTQTASQGMNWVLGIGGLAVIATVAGVVAASSASSPTTFSHN